MEPIISPWIIYFMDLANKLYILSSLTAIISGLTLTTLSLIYLFDIDFDTEKEKKEQSRGYIKKVFYFFAISVIISILTPTKDTMIAMLAVSFVTPENIVITEDHIVELINKIIEAVNKH